MSNENANLEDDGAFTNEDDTLIDSNVAKMRNVRSLIVFNCDNNAKSREENDANATKRIFRDKIAKCVSEVLDHAQQSKREVTVNVQKTALSKFARIAKVTCDSKNKFSIEVSNNKNAKSLALNFDEYALKSASKSAARDALKSMIDALTQHEIAKGYSSTRNAFVQLIVEQEKEAK